MDNGYCRKHKIKKVPLVMPGSDFCPKCDDEKVTARKLNTDGVYIPPPPNLKRELTYYTVLEVKKWKRKPQLARLYKNRDVANTDLENLQLSNLGIKFRIAKMTTEVECAHWWPNGVSAVKYAIWSSNDVFPPNANGNHGTFDTWVAPGRTPSKMRKLSPKKIAASSKPRPARGVPRPPKTRKARNKP